MTKSNSHRREQSWFVHGDLFDYIPTYRSCIAHLTNNRAVMGAGFAKQLKEKFSIVPPVQTLGTTAFDEYGLVHIAHMCAQDGYWTPGSEKRTFVVYKHLAECMEQVASYCNEYNLPILCPRFGAGLAGGDWNVIRELIETIWRNQDVTVYSLAR